jgi:DNA polymerase-3 subunit epsilon/ATP-dependent DNA helicase DinG
MSQTYVSLDLETTGLSPEGDEIIEIAAVKFEAERTLDTFHTLVNPHRPLPYRIQVLTGIAPADVEAAPSWPVAAGELASFVDSCPIVGQNIAFDLDFLAARGIKLANPAYDTFDLANLLLRLSDYGLASVAEHLGISPRPRHRALPDALAAMGVFLALLDRAAELDISLIAEINGLTAATGWSLRPLFLEIERAKLEAAKGKAGDEIDLEGMGRGRAEKRAEKRAEDLVSEAEAKPVDISRLLRLLEPGGPLDRAFPGFEHRPEQVRMMQAVAQALNDRKHLLVEAGTGTGKSIAYLLPAIFFASQNGARVVISTNTINLQEQLMTKDIVDLLTALNLPALELRVAQLKGRTNYLCLRRWDTLRQSQAFSSEEAWLLVRILVWRASTASGDRAELYLRVGEALIWNRLCAQEESCLAARCIYQQRGDCFLFRARREAQAAHLVVINHALLLSDLAASSRVVPDYEYLIIDEAHHLEEEATQQFGFQIGAHHLLDYLNRLSQRAGEELHSGLIFDMRNRLRGGAVAASKRRDLDKLAGGIQTRIDGARIQISHFFDALSRFWEAHSPGGDEYEPRLRLTGAVRAEPAWAGVALSWENLSLALRDIETALGQLHEALEGLSHARIPDYDNLMVELVSWLHSNFELRCQIDSTISHPEADRIYWGSLSARSGVTLCSAPLEVGRILQELLFSEKNCVILTSATLSTEGTFEYIEDRLGLAGVRELLLGAPFDYLTSTLIYIPQGIPEPGKPGYQEAVGQALLDLFRVTQGKALVLFTSHAALRATHAVLKGPLEEEGILVLGQVVDGAPKQLMTAFRTNPKAVLLGTSSLWEGVDVVGGALSVLVIARLPFSVPTDPIFAARSETFDDAFNQYALPRAALRFKQGFGRLIRSRVDRGVMIILDRRIQTKRYGAVFLESLPLCTVKSGPPRHMPQEVVSWLERG